MNTNFRRAAFAAVLSLAATAAPAFAQTSGGELSVSATVTNNCVVSTTPMAFGNVDVTSGSNIDGAAQLSVRCTSGANWTATANAGMGTGATLNQRRMQDGANLLSYNLYTDPGRATIWGDAVGEAFGNINGTGNGSAQLTTIYGRVFGGQDSLPSGNYNDTVQVTVAYD